MKETYTYYPKGTCSTEMIFELEDGYVRSLKVVSGCNGNLKGIASLVKDMPIEEVIAKLDGITCGMKPTSCPDQIAKGLAEYQAGR